jgi:hypothetical protein
MRIQEPDMHHQRARTLSMPRDRAFWIAASVLLVGQLIAFWTVCTQQVRLAQARHASQQLEQMAVADCLRHVHGATLAACARAVAPQDNQLAAAAESAEPQAVPVNYVYH